LNIDYINLLKAGIILVLGYIFARMLKTLAEKLLLQLSIVKYKKLVGRAVFYGIFLLFLFSALDQVGFDLNILLGAAGILSVAIGFASQTSVSNFISGLFLIFDRVISEGDIITIDGITGEVLSVDLLSTKLKTADNVFVRVPNEALIKSKLANLSRFSERRLDLTVMLPYEHDLSTIKSLWFTVIASDSRCLKDPAPGFAVQSIIQDGTSILFSVWVKEKDYDILKNELQQKMLQVFAENNLKPYISHKLTLETTNKHDSAKKYS